MSEQRQREIASAFRKIDITLSELQLQQFETYYEMLIKKNEVMNLTAITEFSEVVIKHFVDSLMLKEVYDPKNIPDLRVNNVKVLDLGTGAGFPGIPLKIVYPELQIDLLDSLNKRIGFLQGVIRELKLEKIQAFHGRAEDYAKKAEFREQYDICVSRAVANLSSLSEYCLPFVKVDGEFISYKAEKAAEEIDNAGKAIAILGGRLSGKKEVYLPGTEMYRCLVAIKKIKPTPKKYPRKAGMPTKEPL